MKHLSIGCVILAAMLFGEAVVSAPLDDARDALQRGDLGYALTVLRPLADEGNAEAQYFLGSMYATGRGQPQSYAEAEKLIRKSAEKGHAPAQYSLGGMYQQGLGVSRDDVEAVRWYRRAAEQDFILAQHSLGMCYTAGVGVARDDAAAVAWFIKAAERGFAGSQFQLSLAYGEGHGVMRNLVEAYKWISLAAQNTQGHDHEVAADWQRRLAAVMTSSQIEQALNSAREWAPMGSAEFPYRVPGYTSIGKGNASAVSGGQQVDVGSYLVSAPPGDGWRMWVDPANGMVMFVRVVGGKGFAQVSVWKRMLNPGMEQKTEDDVLAAIARFEEANMKARGSTRSYTPSEFKVVAAAIGDKRVRLMTYSVTDLSRAVVVQTRAAMYIYLPPDFKEARQVYLFSIEQAVRVGEAVFSPDLTAIVPVIESLHGK